MRIGTLQWTTLTAALIGASTIGYSQDSKKEDKNSSTLEVKLQKPINKQENLKPVIPQNINVQAHTLPVKLEEMIADSDRIFSGICTKATKIDEIPGTKIRTEQFTFKAIEGIKGIDGKKEVDFKQFYPLVQGYEVGKKYILFLSPNSKSSGLTAPIGLEQGRFDVYKKDGKEDEYVVYKGVETKYKEFVKTVRSVIKNSEFEDSLKTKGAKGLIHASVPETDMFVFTAGNIFGEHYSLIPKNNDVKTKLQNTTRHQAVTIFGTVVDKGTLQKHILVTNIEPGEKWEPKVKFGYKDQGRIPELAKHLQGKKEIVASVHALLHGGEVLVVNYKGHNIPVYVEDPKWTKDLWSNDRLKLQIELQDHAKGPPHLYLRSEKKEVSPIRVLESMSALQGKEKKVEGALVWFPKSPGSDVQELWGIEDKDPVSGISRVYALFNLSDENELKKIDSVLRDAWNKKQDGFIRQSSSFYHPEIRISVEGTINQFFRNQRNPVIDVEAKNIKVLP